MGFSFFVFFAGNVASLKTQIFKKIQKPKYGIWRKEKEKEKNQFVIDAAGAH